MDVQGESSRTRPGRRKRGKSVFKFTVKKKHVAPDKRSDSTRYPTSAEELRRMTPARPFIVHVYEPASSNGEDSMDADDDEDLYMQPNQHRPLYTTWNGRHWKAIPTVFRKGDDAVLHSASDDTSDEWIGRIDQIRRGENGESWACVTWYRSKRDLASYVRTFDSTYFAPKERVLSDMSDIISCRSFIRVTKVHIYEERSLQPPNLSPGDFFWRCTFEYRMRSIQPKLAQYSCLCHQAYNPFPTNNAECQGISGERSVNVSHDTMHFCPRPNCSQWYHESCLALVGFVESSRLSHQGDSMLRRLAVDPDSDAPHPYLAKFCEHVPQHEPNVQQPQVPACPPVPQKRKRGRPRKHHLPGSLPAQSTMMPSTLADVATALLDPPKRKRGRPRKHPLPPPAMPPPPHDETRDYPEPPSRVLQLQLFALHEPPSALDSLSSLLLHLPSALVHIAQSPIVRRPGPAFDGLCPVGNAAEVVLARRLVYGALSGIRAVPGGNWSPQVDQLIELVERMDEGEPLRRLRWVEDPDDSGEAVADDDGDGMGGLRVVCDELSRSTLLASPYGLYWERRAHQLEKLGWTRLQWPFLCPKCGADI